MRKILSNLTKHRACAPGGHYSWIDNSDHATTVPVLSTDLRNCRWSEREQKPVDLELLFYKE